LEYRKRCCGQFDVRLRQWSIWKSQSTNLGTTSSCGGLFPKGLWPRQHAPMKRIADNVVEYSGYSGQVLIYFCQMQASCYLFKRSRYITSAVATGDLLPSFPIPLLQWMAREAANLHGLGRVDFCHQVWRGHLWINQPLRAGDQLARARPFCFEQSLTRVRLSLFGCREHTSRSIKERVFFLVASWHCHLESCLFSEILPFDLE
jgi:hypothetical protein